jgi:hypothetical protein
MAMGEQHVIMCTHPDTGKVFYIDAENKSSSTAPTGYQVRVPVSPAAWNSMAYQDKKDSVEVVALPFTQTVPTPLISTWPSGPVESYAHGIGFRYLATIPKDVTASMLLELRPGGLKAFNLIVGGPVTTPNIPFQSLMGLEGRTAGSPESTFSVKIDPAEINFIPNRSISEFAPIAELFRGSLSHAGVVMNWTEGPGVYARLVFKKLPIYQPLSRWFFQIQTCYGTEFYYICLHNKTSSRGCCVRGWLCVAKPG